MSEADALAAQGLAEMAAGFAEMTPSAPSPNMAGLRSDIAAFRGEVSAAVTRMCEATEGMGDRVDDQLGDVRRIIEPGAP